MISEHIQKIRDVPIIVSIRKTTAAAVSRITVLIEPKMNLAVKNTTTDINTTEMIIKKPPPAPLTLTSSPRRLRRLKMVPNVFSITRTIISSITETVEAIINLLSRDLFVSEKFLKI